MDCSGSVPGMGSSVVENRSASLISPAFTHASSASDARAAASCTALMNGSSLAMIRR